MITILLEKYFGFYIACPGNSEIMGSAISIYFRNCVDSAINRVPLKIMLCSLYFEGSYFPYILGVIFQRPPPTPKETGLGLSDETQNQKKQRLMNERQKEYNDLISRVSTREQKYFSLMPFFCRTSNLQFSLILQTHVLVL